MDCPPQLLGITAQDIRPTYLYSYWLTIHFLLYLALGRFMPKWTNPYPMVIIGFIIQLVMFYRGRKVMPTYFIVGVLIWKLVITLGAIGLFAADWSLPTVLFNLVIVLIYLLYMQYRHMNPFDIYMCIESNPRYYPATAMEFLRLRLKPSFSTVSDRYENNTHGIRPRCRPSLLGGANP